LIVQRVNGGVVHPQIWDHSTFSANRERLFNEDLARAFIERVKLSAQWSRLASDEHFGVDGTLIEAWASHKSFKRKDDESGTPPGRNPEVDFKGQQRCNDTHASTTEREAALAMLERRGSRNKRAHGRVDKGYDSNAFIKGCRKLRVTPHVAAKDEHSAVDGRIQRHDGYKTSLKVRKRIEEAFGWAKYSGRSGQDQADRSGQAHGAGAAVPPTTWVAHGQHQRLVGRASCVSPGIRASEMGEKACKQASRACEIASQARRDGSRLRNQRYKSVR
jgi:hypothetical protein